MIRRDLTRADVKGVNNIQDLLLETLLEADVKVMPAYLKKNWETLVAALKTRTAALGDKPTETAPNEGAPKAK
jgi:hypothetical protein